MSQVSVTYLGGTADYTIIAEAKGIFTVQLLQFSGPDFISPPATITLAKGTRKWIGSIEDDLLLEQIGKEIERVLSSGKEDVSFTLETDPFG
jgi:hypothetical protein